MTGIYVIDTSVLIESAKNHHIQEVFSGFWHWLRFEICEQRVLLLDKVKDEILQGMDPATDLSHWLTGLKICDTRQTDILAKYKQVMQCTLEIERYNASACEKFAGETSADAWLIACALATKGIVVTNETRWAEEILNQCQASGTPELRELAKKFHRRDVDRDFLNAETFLNTEVQEEGKND